MSSIFYYIKTFKIQNRPFIFHRLGNRKTGGAPFLYSRDPPYFSLRHFPYSHSLLLRHPARSVAASAFGSLVLCTWGVLILKPNRKSRRRVNVDARVLMQNRPNSVYLISVWRSAVDPRIPPLVFVVRLRPSKLMPFRRSSTHRVLQIAMCSCSCLSVNNLTHRGATNECPQPAPVAPLA